MNIVKKRTAAALLFILPFLVVGSRVQGMELVKKHGLETLGKVGVGALIGGTFTYLTTKKGGGSTQKLKMLKADCNELTLQKTMLSIWKQNVKDTLKLPSDSNPTGKKEAQKKLVFMGDLYKKLNEELIDENEKLKLEDFSVDGVFKLYRKEVGGENTIAELLKVIGIEVKENNRKTLNRKTMQLPKDYQKTLVNFAKESMKMRKVLTKFLGKKVTTADELKTAFHNVRMKLRNKRKKINTNIKVADWNIWQIAAGDINVKEYNQ